MIMMIITVLITVKIMIIPVTSITTRTLGVIVDVYYFILQQSCYSYMTNHTNQLLLVVNLLIYLLICILTKCIT